LWLWWFDRLGRSGRWDRTPAGCFDVDQAGALVLDLADDRRRADASIVESFEQVRALV
jgi:hypothetical protein